MEINVKPSIRYVKIKTVYKRSLQLTRRTRRQAAFRKVAVLPRTAKESVTAAGKT